MVGQRHFHQRGGAVVFAQQGQRHVIRVDDRVGFALPAFAGQGLTEVASLVEQAHADNRNAQVRGGLQVVASQNPQAAGVLRQNGRHAEFSREIPNRAGLVGIVELGLEPLRLFQVIAQVTFQCRSLVHNVRVCRKFVQFLDGNRTEESRRVVADFLPDLRI